MYNYDLRRVSTKSQLLTYIGAEELWFDLACNFDVVEYDQALRKSVSGEVGTYIRHSFERHEIPKRNPSRGRRVVWEANAPLGNIYKGLARRLTRFFEIAISGFPHSQCFGYVRGRNIRNNAQLHTGATLLLKTDIQDFFPTITRRRVEQLFKGLGVEAGTSELIARFLTIDDRLALGLPTSPIIANAICHELDCELHELAAGAGSTYSRYADDLSFSSDSALPEVSGISEIVEKHGFELAADKTRTTKRGQNHYVTGLSVSDPMSPHAPRPMKRGLRQELFYARKFGLGDHIGSLGIFENDEVQRYINHLDGRVRYVAFHEPRKASELVSLWQEILNEEGAEVSFEPKNQHTSMFSFFVDETEFEWKGRKYLALGLSASQKQDVIDATTERILNDYLADPFSDGDLKAIQQNGMHFSHATEDLRSLYVQALKTLPFQGYIVFGKQHGDFEADYTRLLDHIIKRRLMAAESKGAELCFEQSSKVSKNAIEAVVRGAWEELRQTNNRRPKFVSVNVVDKNWFGVGVPDFLLGVFRRYVLSDPAVTPPLRQQNMFEGLRDKIRVIVNADTGEEFTRRHPFENSSMPRS